MTKVLTNGKVLNKSETKVEFGTKAALSGTTPNFARRVFDYWFWIAGVIGLVVTTFTEIPVTTSLLITKALIVANFAVRGWAKMNGIVEDK